MKIINLTQHNASADQIEASVIEQIAKEEIKKLLTFDDIPSKIGDIVIEEVKRIYGLVDIEDLIDFIEK